VTSQGITDPVPVFEDTMEVAWEVEEFRERFRKQVLPRVTSGASVELEARLSESPEVRRQIAEEVRAALVKAGAAKPQVRILSAYKQGFLWLTEQVIPSLKGKNVRSIRIVVASKPPDLAKKYKFYEVPTRWVHELYPIDEIFTRDLALGPDAFHIELADAPKDVYTVEAIDATGRVVERATFSPKTVEREYLDKFPGWSRVTVTTGWIAASVNRTSVIDARIATDPERFWDYYQSKVLPRMYDHVMKVTENKPLPDKQPFHRDLDVEVWMSEPDYRLGVDEELVSSLESLHEDLYFVTLDFFDALGRTTVKRRLAGPGKIFPIIHPDRSGRPGQVRILYAGNASTKPKIELAYKEKGNDKPVKSTREIPKVDASTPQVLRAIVTADAIKELELAVDAKDDREAARAADAWDALATLHAAGLFRTALSYDQVGKLALSIATKEARTRRVVAHTGTSEPSRVRRSADKPPRPLITWDHVISPEESEQLITKLAAYPEIHAYRAGRSYRGRDTSVMEIRLPNGGELLSLAKATALKPTIFITGRQHANEVSSTSHILRLAELLVSDPAYRPILQKVNVILHPVENPDGAAMAYELQKLTPTHMLHAGRYSALGMDVASQVGLEDPLLPESLVRGKVWRDWLPDIYLNPHGYPSHEWVQQFAGYVPPGFRSYWSSRGWWTQMAPLRDPRYPEHARVAETIREHIVREVNSYPDVKAMNLRHQARYRRWAHGFAPYVFGQEIYKDTAIYFTDPESGQPTGSRRAGATRGAAAGGGSQSGRDVMGAWPQVTYFNGMTEAPDETAQGSWLDLVTKPGFGFLMASVRYLLHGEFEVQRLEEDGQRDATTITLFRLRPVKPGRATQGETTATK
jgi:Zinc carboxypeptidase